MGEVSLGTVYEINKNLMRREEKLSKPAFANKLKLVKNFFLKNEKYLWNYERIWYYINI